MTAALNGQRALFAKEAWEDRMRERKGSGPSRTRGSDHNGIAECTCVEVHISIQFLGTAVLQLL